MLGRMSWCRLLVLGSFVVGSATVATSAFIYYRFGRRIQNGDWINPRILTKQRWIRGVVTNGHRWPFKFRKLPTLAKDLKNQTIHIRIAGVDAPEGSHFGREGQPYHKESLKWLRNKILGRVVYCQVLRRDQYSRIVAFFSGRSLAMDMLKAGWATTYEQAGAEYGKWGKEEYLRIEAEAKAARRGMWKLGITAETPAAYKRRHAQGADVASVAKPVGTARTTKSRLNTASWWKRIWSR
ncbi:hypothetical protein BDQ17DRAFT_1398541 [Cyathus striatus]|nr:hypothetical protein BDQ17DRAFT_1398541 [Cyathus striatus]